MVRIALSRDAHSTAPGCWAATLIHAPARDKYVGLRCDARLRRCGCVRIVLCTLARGVAGTRAHSAAAATRLLASRAQRHAVHVE